MKFREKEYLGKISKEGVLTRLNIENKFEENT